MYIYFLINIYWVFLTLKVWLKSEKKVSLYYTINKKNKVEYAIQRFIQ